MICSDAVSRGLHIEEVELVVNYQVPNHVETYVHRVGRTARADKSGMSISLLAPYALKNFLRLTSQVEGSDPSEWEIDNSFVHGMIPMFQECLEKLKCEITRS